MMPKHQLFSNCVYQNLESIATYILYFWKKSSNFHYYDAQKIYYRLSIQCPNIRTCRLICANSNQYNKQYSRKLENFAWNLENVAWNFLDYSWNIKHFGQNLEDFVQNLKDFAKNLEDFGIDLKEFRRNAKDFGEIITYIFW